MIEEESKREDKKRKMRDRQRRVRIKQSGKRKYRKGIVRERIR